MPDINDQEFTPPETHLLTAVFALALRDFHAEVKKNKGIAGALKSEVGQWLMSSERAGEHPDRPLTCRFICDHIGLSHHKVRRMLTHNWRSLMDAVQTLKTEAERGGALTWMANAGDEEMVSEHDAALFLGIGVRELAARRRSGVDQIPVTIKVVAGSRVPQPMYRMADLRSARGAVTD